MEQCQFQRQIYCLMKFIQSQIELSGTHDKDKYTHIYVHEAIMKPLYIFKKKHRQSDEDAAKILKMQKAKFIHQA